jgi:predicted transcriptional regulator
MTTTEVADEVGLSQQAMSRHLKRMEGEGLLRSDKIGSAKIWWPTDDGLAQLSPSRNGPSDQ